MRSSMRYVIEMVDPAREFDAASRAFGCFSSHIEKFYPVASSWFATIVLPEFARGKRRIWIASSDGKARGIAITKSDLEGEREQAKICTLFVNPLGRSCGIGTALLGHVVDWHDEQMFSSLRIRCPVRVRHMLEGLLSKRGFSPDKGIRIVPVSLEPEVTFRRLYPALRGALACELAYRILVQH